MEDNKTKYIESSLAALRVINYFVLQKGAYPKNFDSDFWKGNPHRYIAKPGFFFELFDVLAE
jgi:hypothetical protein